MLGHEITGEVVDIVMVPYADWNLLRFLDLAMLTDIFPTGYHGCVSAGVTTGSTVYIAGAGPVGLAARPRRCCWARLWSSSAT